LPGNCYSYQQDDKIKLRTPDDCEVKQKWKKGKYEEKIKCKPTCGSITVAVSVPIALYIEALEKSVPDRPARRRV
jgi:hypothetical protein